MDVIQDNFLHLFGLILINLALVFQDLNLHLSILIENFIFLCLLIEFSHFGFPLLHLAKFLDQVLILFPQISILLFRKCRNAFVSGNSLILNRAAITGTNAQLAITVEVILLEDLFPWRYGHLSCLFSGHQMYFYCVQILRASSWGEHIHLAFFVLIVFRLASLPGLDPFVAIHCRFSIVCVVDLHQIFMLCFIIYLLA